MTTYFDPNDVTHLALLPPEFREAQDLVDVAAEAEADVINRYTQRAPDLRYTAQFPAVGEGDPVVVLLTDRQATLVGDGLYVFLHGYQEDADHASVDPDLKVDLRRAVVELIKWRCRSWSRDPAVQSEGNRDGMSRAYRDSADEPFPKGWDRWLRKHDTREPAWVL
jgi:hypothetical protein